VRAAGVVVLEVRGEHPVQVPVAAHEEPVPGTQCVRCVPSAPGTRLLSGPAAGS
jgi:hypothetical protein